MTLGRFVPHPSIYIERRLANGADLVAWAKGQGFRNLLRQTDLHATVGVAVHPIYTRPSEPAPVELLIVGGERTVVQLNHDVVALAFAAPQLEERRRELEQAGFQLRGPFRPHVTFAFQPSTDIDLAAPFTDPLRFGPETSRADALGLTF